MRRKIIRKRILAMALLLSMLCGLLPVAGFDIPVSAAPNTLASTAATLLSRINALPAGGDWNGQVYLPAEGAIVKGLRGSYYIARKDASGVFHVIDGRGKVTDGKLNAVGPVQLMSPTIAITGGVTPDMSVTLVPRGVNGSFAIYSFLVGASEKNKVISQDTSANVVLEERTTDPFYLWLSHDCSDTWAIRIRRGITGITPREHCIAFDETNKYFHWTNAHTNSSNALQDTLETKLFLYRLWSTKDLRSALDKIKGFLSDPSAYPQDQYEDFLTEVQTALDLFDRWNGYPSTQSLTPRVDEYIQEILDHTELELLSYISLFEEEAEYIDIPIEILDFRADNLLLQNVNYYAFRTDKRDYLETASKYNNLKDLPNLPGKIWPERTELLSADSSYLIREGLTKPELLDGKLVYEEGVIDYVAHTIYIKGIGNLDNSVIGWNGNFRAMQQAADFTLGSWSDTRTKIVDISGRVTGKNGDNLPFSSVTTAYDLAYYLLNYLWRPVPETDQELLADGYRYNMRVEERQVARLYKNSDGFYTLNADKSMGYAGRYILNAESTEQTRTSKDHPYFAPIDGLGFEAPGVMDHNYDTDVGGVNSVLSGYRAQGTNFLYTMHAGGTFVYSKEENQEFTFLGDDDVYFYLNGRLALDLGGAHSRMTKTLKLNDVAEQLGLVDGNTYTFDMFYAERAPSQANLNFSTNIQIVAYDKSTEKTQYAHTAEGVSMVDPATGLGKPLANNGVINIGETVGYAFSITNDRSLPLVNVSFHDDSLGVDISPDSLTLCDVQNDYEKNNGIATSIEDIRVYYRSCDGTRVNEQTPVELTWEGLLAMLDGTQTTDSAGNVLYSSIPKGSYFIRMNSEAQLMTLLERGIPIRCQLMVYGFLRRTSKDDLPYTNTVSSLCYYTPHEGWGIYPLIGEASCSLSVPDMNNLILPESDVFRTVIDYGKPIRIPVAEMKNLIHRNNGSKVRELVGFTDMGYHGDFLKTAPEDLRDTYISENGIYTVEEDTVIFQLRKMLSQVDKVLAVYKLKDCYGYNSAGGTEEYRYLLQELRIVPATMMYYETDFLKDLPAQYADEVFETQQLGGTASTAWQASPEDEASKETYQDFDPMTDTLVGKVIDTEHISGNAFFADFDGKGYASRYSVNPVYGGYDFDQPQYWVSKWLGDNALTSQHSILTAQGTMHIPVETYEGNTTNINGTYIETTTQAGTFHQDPLLYSPAKGDFLQLRFKFTGNTLTENVKIQLTYNTGDDANYRGTDGGTVDLGRMENDHFITAILPLNDSFCKAEQINNFRVWFANISPGATVIVDYIYLGPEQGIAEDLLHDNCLYFGFDGTDADLARYNSETYDYLNFDLPENWWYNYRESSPPQIIGGTLSYMDVNNEDAKVFNYVHSGPFDENRQGIYPLWYIPGKDDYCRIRVKFENAAYKAGNEEAGLNNDLPQLGLYGFRSQDSNWHLYGSTDIDVADFDNGYVTYTFPLDRRDYLEAEAITAIRPQFHFVNSVEGASAVYTIDYVYVGPIQDSCPASQSLYFDFNNTQTDKERYAGDAYGGNNFDHYDDDLRDGTEYRWSTAYGLSGEQGKAPGSYRDFEILNSSGTLVGYFSNEVTFDDNQTYRLDLATSATPGSYSWGAPTGPLHYRSDRAKVAQIRLKITGCVDGSEEDLFVNDAGWNEAQGDAWDIPRLNLRVDYYADGKGYTIGKQVFSAPVDLKETEFQILTIPLDEQMSLADYITAIDMRFWHIKALEKGMGTVTIDYIYIGPGELAPAPVYGYDSGYENDTRLSDGSSLFVYGNGVKNGSNTTAYTEGSFEFTGTGFDIISRTGQQQGTVRLQVEDLATGEIVKTLTVNNKGELELYQIPVVSVQGLEHGDYRVTFWVNNKVNLGFPALDRGNEFYFDAVRIYDPIDTRGQELGAKEHYALQSYRTDKEAYSHIKEVRNILLTAGNFSTLTELTEGAVFLDVNSSLVDPNEGIVSGGSSDYTTVSVQTYNKIGPKNEVYLAPGQAVAFRMQISPSFIPDSVDIGAKTIGGDSAKLLAAVVTPDTKNVAQITGLTEKELNTATARYFPLKLEESALLTEDEERYCYVVLINGSRTDGSTSHVLSITDIKVAYAQDPGMGLPEDQLGDTELAYKRAREASAYVTFLVDGQTHELAQQALWQLQETPAVESQVGIFHSLDLASDISLNYIVPKEKLEDYDSFRMECKLPVYHNAVLVGTQTLLLSPEARGDYYYFTLLGLTAINMMDEVEATLSMSKNGKSYVSETDLYSIAQYAYGQLGKEGSSRELKTLCADLLRYGALAQTYKGYRTDCLADSAMTEEQRSYLTHTDKVTFDNVNAVQEDLEAPVVLWAGKTLLLDSKVVLRYIVDLRGYEGELSDLSLVLRYTDLEGQAQTVTLSEPTVYYDGLKYYSFDFDGLLAAELRQVVSATVYAGKTPLSRTLNYSASTYGRGKTGDLGLLCACLMAYSDSAKAYFTK